MDAELDERKSNTELAELIRDTWAVEWEAYQLRTRGKQYSFPSSPRWDGGTDAMGRTHKSVWDKAAATVTRRRFHPVKFVRAQFFQWTGEAPQPNMLLGETAILRYSVYLQSLPAQMKAVLKAQGALFQAEVFKATCFGKSNLDAALFVLADTSITLPALFRYCMAIWLREHDCKTTKAAAALERMADTWAAEAQTQYQYHSEYYDEVWGEFIPNCLKRGAI